MATPARPDEGRITPDDIKAKLSQIEGSVQTTAKAAAPIGLAIGAGMVIAALAVAYFFGRRRGIKRQTVVEIRRI